MLASQTSVLQAIIAAVASSRAEFQAQLPGVRLDQANFTFPDGRTVVLSWDEASQDYVVSTPS